VPGGTRVVDEVEFIARLSWASGPFVFRELERIFAFRQDALQRLLGPALQAIPSASAPAARTQPS
jgi:hypothetical protein